MLFIIDLTFARTRTFPLFQLQRKLSISFRQRGTSAAQQNWIFCQRANDRAELVFLERASPSPMAIQEMALLRGLLRSDLPSAPTFFFYHDNVSPPGY